MALLTSVALLFGCGTASETASQSSAPPAETTVDTVTTSTGDTKRDEGRIEVPEYDPQAVQPENWLQLSNAQVQKAVSIGLTDRRLEKILKRNDFEIEEVLKTESLHYRANTTDVAHPAARVTVVLDEPVPLKKSGYTGAICDVGGATGPVTGFVWIADFVEQDVAAFSPQWNYNVSCT